MSPARCGWIWSIAADRDGIPIAWAIDGANRHDMALLGPTFGAVADIGIDDLVCARKRKQGTATKPKPAPLGMRWPVERTNSWLSNHGQLRKNTDRRIIHRLAAMVLTIKLVKWAEPWNH
ncbi:MAG: hypothetical protein ACC658_15305 [Acidimicrobiia bacterium]